MYVYRYNDPVSSLPLSPLPVRTKGCCQPVAPTLAPAEAAGLARIFRALDDPTRVRMVRVLAEASAPVCVCDFTATFELSQPTVSHHLARLRAAGLVTSSRRGLWAFYELNATMTAAARAAVELVRSASG